MLASRIEDLLTIARTALTVEQIATLDPYALPASEPANKAFDSLWAHSFDFALVDEVPVGRYIGLSDLTGADDNATVADLAKSITTRELISANAGLADGIGRLAHLPVLFVLRTDGELGIITPADLQRPAVGMIAHSFILAAEAGLVALLENRLGDGLSSALEAALSPKALGDAERLHELKRERHAELTLAASLTLGSRLEVVRCTPELRRLLGYASKTAVERDKRHLIRTRDALAHAGDMLATVDGDPARAIEVLEGAQAFAERVRGALLRQEPSG